MNFAILAVSATLALAASAGTACAQDQWTLDGDASRVSFLSVKGGEVIEAHSFETLSGGVSAEGAAELRIDLDSVETNIDIRNERMREFLFQTADFPEARLAANVDLAAFDDLAIGARRMIDMTGELALHGVSASIYTTVIVTRIGEDRALVETASPVLVDAGAFGMGAGVEMLREIANLPSIAPTAPVSVSLVFER